MTSGVYMITLLTTKERYIGSSINVEQRMIQHKVNGVLKGFSVSDYSLEILEHVQDVEKLRLREWELCLQLKPELNKRIPNEKKGVGLWKSSSRKECLSRSSDMNDIVEIRIFVTPEKRNELKSRAASKGMTLSRYVLHMAETQKQLVASS